MSRSQAGKCYTTLLKLTATNLHVNDNLIMIFHFLHTMSAFPGHKIRFKGQLKRFFYVHSSASKKGQKLNTFNVKL